MRGDRVRLAPDAADGDPELADGRPAWIAAQEPGGRYWLDTRRGGPFLGPYAEGELVDARDDGAEPW